MVDLVSRKAFPRQPNQEGGWLISVKFLTELQALLESSDQPQDEIPSLEQIEMTLWALERIPSNEPPVSEDIREIEEALAESNAPYTRSDDTGDVFDKNGNVISEFIYHEEDANLIANTPKWLRYLIDQLAAARTENERMITALTEIRSSTEWAKNGHRQDVCKQVYDDANEALIGAENHDQSN